jgi:predicted dehydrogenase
MYRVRLGVVGAGVIGRTHLDAIARARGFELAGIVEPGPEGAHLAAVHGTVLHPTLDALIEHGRAEGVIVATPNETHVDIALRCLTAGLPVLVEKPIANTIGDAWRLARSSAETGIPVLVGHHRRYNPIVRTAKLAIDGGAIGALRIATVVCSLMKPASYFDVAWRRESGVGGPLLINLIHEVDLLRHFFGDVATVTAMCSSEARRLPVEDAAAALLHFEKGGMATLAVSDAAVGPWAWDITAGENLERFPAHAAQSHHFAGSRGGLSLPHLEFWTHEAGGDWTRKLKRTKLAAGSADSYVEQIGHFGDVVRGRAQPIVSALEGTKNLATITAIRAAAESGKLTPVPRAEPAV